MDRLVKADVKEVNLTFTRGQKSTATFRLTNLMHAMSVAVSLSTTNPSFSFTHPFSILPPLSASSFTLHLAPPSDHHPPLSSPPDTIVVRSSLLPTGKARQDDLHRLFSKRGAHIFKDATIPISLVGPHVVEFLLLSPRFKTLEVSFLLSKSISGCDESELTSLLRSSARNGNSCFVSALIVAGADINYRDSDGQSIMSLAVQSGNRDSVQALIDSGYVINSVDSLGRTALHVAAIHGHVEVLQFLVSMGADPDIVDCNKWTPLHCAAAEGHDETAEFLLNCSSFVKYAVTTDGKTAFDLAVEKGRSHLYDSLNLGDVLQRAARIDDVGAMKKCLSEGAKVNGRDQYGWTPLHRAAFKGRIESVKLLLGNGARVDLVDDGGYTPIHRAVEAGHVQVAMCLLAHGAKANAKCLKTLKGFEMVAFDSNCFKNLTSLVSIKRERELDNVCLLS